MNEETKLLLQLLLKQEIENETEQKKPCLNRKNGFEQEKYIPNLAEVDSSNIDSNDDFDYDPAEKGRKEACVQKEYLNHSLDPEIKASFPGHQIVQPKKKEVPIWEKYALNASEAAEYFHISYTKIREVIKRDKYADFLIWNGNKVYVKRKMFEEYLNKCNSL